jgi:hypothetical protein
MLYLIFIRLDAWMALFARSTAVKDAEQRHPLCDRPVETARADIAAAGVLQDDRRGAIEPADRTRHEIGARSHISRTESPWLANRDEHERCPAAGRLLVLMAAKSAGAGSSSALAWPARSMPKEGGNRSVSAVKG